MHRYTVVMILVVMLVGLVGCFDEKNNQLKRIHIVSTANANQNQAIALDFVFINNLDTKIILNGYNAKDWFDNKNALMQKYSQIITVTSYEMPPLNQVDVKFHKKYKKAKSVMLFALYLSEEGRIAKELGSYKHLTVKLNQDDYDLLEGNK